MCRHVQSSWIGIRQEWHNVKKNVNYLFWLFFRKFYFSIFDPFEEISTVNALKEFSGPLINFSPINTFFFAPFKENFRNHPQSGHFSWKTENKFFFNTFSKLSKPCRGWFFIKSLLPHKLSLKKKKNLLFVVFRRG